MVHFSTGINLSEEWRIIGPPETRFEVEVEFTWTQLRQEVEFNKTPLEQEVCQQSEMHAHAQADTSEFCLYECHAFQSGSCRWVFMPNVSV